MGFFGKKEDKKAAPTAAQHSADVSMDDVRRVLQITDQLLGHLPTEEIDQFIQSEDFKLYKAVLHKLVPEAEMHSEDAQHVQPEHIDELEQIIDARIQEYFDRMGIKPGQRPAPAVQPAAQPPQAFVQQPPTQPAAAYAQPVYAAPQPAPQIQPSQQASVTPRPAPAAVHQPAARPAPAQPDAQPSVAAPQTPPAASQPMSARPAGPIDMAKIKASIEAKLRGGG